MILTRNHHNHACSPEDRHVKTDLSISAASPVWYKPPKCRRQLLPSIIVLPLDVMALTLSFLDGQSLLSAAMVSRAWEKLSHQQQTWQNLCFKAWPELAQSQVLPQLPGAPEYDLIRLYGGSWKRCFLLRHQLNQRAHIQIQVPDFINYPNDRPDRLISPTFTIGRHHFCLWIFPNGNPHEPTYVSKYLSAYLVLTDVASREDHPWTTCAVFSLRLVHSLDASRDISWHSSLSDNRFDAQTCNWGVHSLAPLVSLRDPASGFVSPATGALTVEAHVRLMSLSLSLSSEREFTRHVGFGLPWLSEPSRRLEIPFCATLADLLSAIDDDDHHHHHRGSSSFRLWMFTSPTVPTGQTMRPRSLLWDGHDNERLDRRLFEDLMTDGVDIDAYSFGHLYLEEFVGRLDSPTQPLWSEKMCDDDGLLFIKVLYPQSAFPTYFGRMTYDPLCPVSSVYTAMKDALLDRHSLRWHLVMSKETLASRPDVIASSSRTLRECDIERAEIVIFELLPMEDSIIQNQDYNSRLSSCLGQEIARLYALAQNRRSAPGLVTLADVEAFGARCDLPAFRIRSAFHTCNADSRLTLKYICEGRHVGFICDACGDVDFKERRYHCGVCPDYDVCHGCFMKTHARPHEKTTSRYANVGGTWQRQSDFFDHDAAAHDMICVYPIFYDYQQQKSSMSSL